MINTELHVEDVIDMYNGVVDEDGQLVFPSHGVSLGHVREFIKFLRHCGGFEIC